MSNLLRKYIKNILIEESSFNSARDVADMIVTAGTKSGVPPLKVKKATNKEIRIAAAEGSYNFTDREIETILKNSDLVIVKVIPKSEPGSRSGTFSTYIVTSEDDKKYPIVFSRGKNKGQEFETQLAKEADLLMNKIISPTILSLCNAIKIDITNIKNVKHVGRSKQLRPLSIDITDVGSKIADLVFELKEKDEKVANSEDGMAVYISIKNIKGTTFANMGYAGGFIKNVDENGDPVVLSNVHISDDFLNALGVDKQLAAKGFTNILRGKLEPIVEPLKRLSKKNPRPDVPPSGTQDYEKVQTYLASAYGFGYWYARNMGNDSWIVKKIKDAADALSLVGTISRIDVSYPGVTKQITCNIKTTTGRYIVEIRNTQGGLIPKQVNVSVA